MSTKKLKKGTPVSYSARTHTGTGKVIRVRESGRGVWVDLTRDDNQQPLALRLSQVEVK